MDWKELKVNESKRRRDERMNLETKRKIKETPSPALNSIHELTVDTH